MELSKVISLLNNMSILVRGIKNTRHGLTEQKDRMMTKVVVFKISKVDSGEWNVTRVCYFNSGL